MKHCFVIITMIAILLLTACSGEQKPSSSDNSAPTSAPPVAVPTPIPETMPAPQEGVISDEFIADAVKRITADPGEFGLLFKQYKEGNYLGIQSPDQFKPFSVGKLLDVNPPTSDAVPTSDGKSVLIIYDQIPNADASILGNTGIFLDCMALLPEEQIPQSLTSYDKLIHITANPYTAFSYGSGMPAIEWVISVICVDVKTSEIISQTSFSGGKPSTVVTYYGDKKYIDAAFPIQDAVDYALNAASGKTEMTVSSDGIEESAIFPQYGMFGEQQTDGRSDLYSLGMVMLFLATSAPIRNNLANIRHKGLAEVIGKCIEFAPNARFQSAALLKKNIYMAKHWQLARIRRNFPKLAGIMVALVAVTVLIILLAHNSRTLRSPSVELKENMIAQVVRQWNNIEADEQIKQSDIQRFQSPLRIIGNVPSPIDESLNIRDCHYEYFTGGVKISTRGDIETLEDIKGMTSLLELGLIYQRITDLTDISALRLRTLDIDNNEVRDISPLAGMDSLTGLFLSENPIESIEPVAGLKNLAELDISTTKVSDISALAGLEKLAVLIMRRVSVPDLSVFDQLPALNDISMTSVIADDFSPLRRHQGWQRLDVSFTNMENPLDIEYTDQMVFLNVGGTSLTSLDGIERFGKLTELWIHETGIQSLDGIENLHSLQKLYLHYTEVSDISPIAGLANLREIDVGYTKITDLTPLLGRERPLTIICSGLSEEVLAPMRGQPNIILDY